MEPPHSGVAVTGLVFDLVIPSDSFLRKSEFTQGASGSGANSGIVTSGLNVGDFFIVSNSNVGHGLTSLNTDGSAVGVGTTYIDNVYRVAHRTFITPLMRWDLDLQSLLRLWLVLTVSMV